MMLTEKQKKILLMALGSGVTEKMARKVFSSESHILDVFRHLAEQGFLRPEYGTWWLTPEGKEYLSSNQGKPEEDRLEKMWVVIDNLQQRVANLEKVMKHGN